MRLRIYFIVIVSLCALTLGGGVTQTARAHTTIQCETICSHPYQRWVDEAKEPTPDLTITVIEGDCPGRDIFYAACTSPAQRTIWMAVGSRQGLYHELGHNFDADLLSETTRARFMEWFGLEGPWRMAGEPEPYGPDEWFADVYAQCAQRPYLGPRWMRRMGLGPIFEEGPIGGTRLHNQICRWLSRS